MARSENGKGRVKRYSREVKEAVIEEVQRTTIEAAEESWGIPHRTVAYWYVRRGRSRGDSGAAKRPFEATPPELAEILGTSVATLVEMEAGEAVRHRVTLALPELDVSPPRRGRKPRKRSDG